MELFDKREFERIEAFFCALNCGDAYENQNGNICICTATVNFANEGKCICYKDERWEECAVEGGELVYPLVASITIHAYVNE